MNYQLHDERKHQELGEAWKAPDARDRFQNGMGVLAVQPDDDKRRKRDGEAEEAEIEENRLHGSPQSYCESGGLKPDARALLRVVDSAYREAKHVPAGVVEPRLRLPGKFGKHGDAVLRELKIP